MNKSEYKYQKQVTIGFDANGKRVRKRFYANSQSDLTRQIADSITLFKANNGADGMTLELYIELWLSANMANREANTEEYYTTGFKKLEPLYKKQLKDITKTDLQKIIADNWDMPRTCKKIKQISKKLFNNAIDDRYITINPASNLNLPKYKPQEKSLNRRPLTDAEKRAIENVKLCPKEHLFLMLAYYFGLRPQEIRALTISSFNLKKKELTIDKAVAVRNNQAYIKSTKNHETRVLPIPDAIIPEITSYIAKCDTLYLFTMQNKELMSKTAYGKINRRILREIKKELNKDFNINITSNITFYTLRHNVGTMLYYKCLSPNPNQRLSFKKAAYFMGHSEKVFLETYSHIEESQETLENVFEKIS